MKIECEVCGKRFDRTVPWKRYCSGRCRQIAWATRQFEKAHKTFVEAKREGDGVGMIGMIKAFGDSHKYRKAYFKAKHGRKKR